jgi:thiol-disulfide isomerase/thioredoxin
MPHSDVREPESALPPDPPSASDSASDPVSEPPQPDPVYGSLLDIDLNAADGFYAGHTLTMINIWATWCGPCLNEMPDLGLLHQQYADRGFQVVGIMHDALDYSGNLDADTIAYGQEIIDGTGATYLHLLPNDDHIGTLLSSLDAFPTTVFLDSEGNLVGGEYIGSRPLSEWEAIVEPLLDEVGA